MRLASMWARAAGVSGLWVAAAAPVSAQSSEALPLWEIGAFGVGVSQQAYPGSDQQVSRGLALPYVVYRGRFLRADRETAGLRAIKTPRLELDVGVAGSFGARSEDIDARRGMPDLGTLVEFGPRLKWNLGEEPTNSAWRFELPLRGVFDLSDHAAYRGLALEPRLVFQRRAQGGWAYTTGLSAIVADQRLASTFYSVAPAYALTDRPAYAAERGLVAWRLSVSVSRNLSKDWRLFGFGRYDTVSGAANESSPLVKRTGGGSIGIGLAYTWMRSERTASD
jgi:outer membrane protein